MSITEFWICSEVTVGFRRWLSCVAFLCSAVPEGGIIEKSLLPARDDGYISDIRLRLKCLNICGPWGEGRPRDDADIMRLRSTLLILCTFRFHTDSQPHTHDIHVKVALMNEKDFWCAKKHHIYLVRHWMLVALSALEYGVFIVGDRIVSSAELKVY